MTFTCNFVNFVNFESLQSLFPMLQLWKDSALCSIHALPLSIHGRYKLWTATDCRSPTKAPVWGKSRMRIQTQNCGAARGERVHATEELMKQLQLQIQKHPDCPDCPDLKTLWHSLTEASQDLDQTNSPAEQHLQRNKGQRTWWKSFDGTCPGDTVDKEQQAWPKTVQTEFSDILSHSQTFSDILR